MTEPKPTYTVPGQQPISPLQAEILKFSSALKAIGVTMHTTRLYGGRAEVCLVLPGVKWEDVEAIVSTSE